MVIIKRASVQQCNAIKVKRVKFIVNQNLSLNLHYSTYQIISLNITKKIQQKNQQFNYYYDILVYNCAILTSSA